MYFPVKRTWSATVELTATYIADRCGWNLQIEYVRHGNVI